MSVRLHNKLVVLVLSLTPAMAMSAGSCNVAVSDVTFGVYDVFNVLPTDGSGAVSVTCTDDGAPGGLNVDVSIALSPSATSGTTANRQMERIGGTERLNYNLFRDVGYSQIWGNTAGVDDFLIHNVKVPKKGSITVTPPITIYGRISPAQDVPAGSYTDSVALTINP